MKPFPSFEWYVSGPLGQWKTATVGGGKSALIFLDVIWREQVGRWSATVIGPSSTADDTAEFWAETEVEGKEIAEAVARDRWDAYYSNETKVKISARNLVNKLIS